MWKRWDVVTAVINYYMNKGHCSVNVPLSVLSDMSLHFNWGSMGNEFLKLLTLAMPLQRNFICFIKLLFIVYI